MPIGSIYYTPEQQLNYRKRKVYEIEKSIRRQMANPLGRFYFILSDERFNGLSSETVARLIYLNTFINYENNRLMLSERKPMRRKDLSEVLRVSKSTVSRFWNDISPKYIVEGENGYMFSNREIFKRGRLSKQQYVTYQKVYIEGVRKLYSVTDRKYHRHLGYFFKLLPFINVEYNLLCCPDSVMKTRIEDIELISISDFCKWIDYDVKHLNDLVSTYRNISFDVEGKQERFCTLIYDGVNKKSAKICINPHILYNGSDYNKVEVLGAFCKL